MKTPEQQMTDWGCSVEADGERIVLEVLNRKVVLPPDDAQHFLFYFSRAIQDARWLQRRRSNG